MKDKLYALFVGLVIGTLLAMAGIALRHALSRYVTESTETRRQVDEQPIEARERPFRLPKTPQTPPPRLTVSVNGEQPVAYTPTQASDGEMERRRDGAEGRSEPSQWPIFRRAQGVTQAAFPRLTQFLQRRAKSRKYGILASHR